MRFSSSPFTGLPVVVKNLLIINVIVFLIKITGLGDFMGRDMDSWFGLHFFTSPLFEPWQLVTHMFMHAGPEDGGRWFLHIGFNMLGLFMFGPPLEYRWGSKRFFTFYMITGIGAALFYSGVHLVEYFQLMNSLGYDTVRSVEDAANSAFADGGQIVTSTAEELKPLIGLLYGGMVGASGALYGILLAFGILFPNVELIIFPIPIPIKARYLVFILAGISIALALWNNPSDNVAHLAHLGGMLVGFILLRIWKHRGTSAF